MPTEEGTTSLIEDLSQTDLGKGCYCAAGEFTSVKGAGYKRALDAFNAKQAEYRELLLENVKNGINTATLDNLLKYLLVLNFLLSLSTAATTTAFSYLIPSLGVTYFTMTPRNKILSNPPRVLYYRKKPGQEKVLTHIAAHLKDTLSATDAIKKAILFEKEGAHPDFNPASQTFAKACLLGLRMQSLLNFQQPFVFDYGDGTNRTPAVAIRRWNPEIGEYKDDLDKVLGRASSERFDQSCHVHLSMHYPVPAGPDTSFLHSPLPDDGDIFGLEQGEVGTLALGQSQVKRPRSNSASSTPYPPTPGSFDLSSLLHAL